MNTKNKRFGGGPLCPEAVLFRKLAQAWMEMCEAMCICIVFFISGWVFGNFVAVLSIVASFLLCCKRVLAVIQAQKGLK